MTTDKTLVEPMDDNATVVPNGASDGLGAPSLKGRKIGAFEVGRKIGQGGMGMVYEAYEPSLDRTIALKILPPQMAADGEWVARFTREARTAARLDHPGIAHVYAADRTADGLCYIAMQYVPGCDLASWLKRGQRLPIEVALKVTREIAVALAYAHEAGVVHRDIKPDNVRIEPSGRVVVMDFGLAYRSRGARMTDVGTFLGTPEYCSPEQCEAGATDHRSDLYSLGVCLYEMISGTVPHRAPTPYQLFRKIIEDLPVPVREIDANVPRGVAKVVDRLLAKRADDRHANAAELVVELDRLFRHEAVELAAFFTQIAAEDRETASARTVEIADRGSQNTTWVEEVATPAAPASTTRSARPSRNTRRTFAPRALRSRSRAITALVLVSACLALGLGAVASLPDNRLMAPLEARTPTQAGFAPPMRADRVAILEFQHQGIPADPKLAWLRICLPEMLSISLAPRLPELHFVSSASAQQALANAKGVESAAARALGAGLYVSGSYVVQGTNAIFYASLNRIDARGESVIDGVSCSGDREDFLAVVDSLAAKLLNRFGPMSKKLAADEPVALHQVLQKQTLDHAASDTVGKRRGGRGYLEANHNAVHDGAESEEQGAGRGAERAGAEHRTTADAEKGGKAREDRLRAEAGATPSEDDAPPAIGGGPLQKDEHAKADAPKPTGGRPAPENKGDKLPGAPPPPAPAQPDPTAKEPRDPSKTGDFGAPPLAGAARAAGTDGGKLPPEGTNPGAGPASQPADAQQQVEQRDAKQGGQVLVTDAPALKTASELVAESRRKMSRVVQLCYQAKAVALDATATPTQLAEARGWVEQAQSLAPEFSQCDLLLVQIDERIGANPAKPAGTK